MTISDLNAIIVVYNTAVSESITYKSIGNTEVNIIICDNSTKDFGNETFCKNKKNITYINMGGNVGLPKAYNKALENIKVENSIVCMFDDDTDIPEGYFEKIIQMADCHKDCDIFVPMVYDEIGLLSPCIMKGNYMHRADSLSEIGENIGAINSAMAVRSSVYKDYNYDENMFLDFVDFAFVREMRKRNKKFFVIEDLIIHQTFSANVDSRENAEIRFGILKKDLKYYYRNAPLYYSYIILRRKAKLCLKFKTLHFLFA